MGVGVDPHRAEPRLDLLHRQIRRQHPLQRAHVPLELRPLDRGLAGVLELGADVPGQVLGRGHQPLLSRVLVDELPQLHPSLPWVGAEEVGDLAEIDAAAGVQADRERVLRRVGAEPRGARDHDPSGENSGRGGGLGGLVEVLEGLHERGERVGAQQPDRGRGDAGHPLLAGGRVGAAGPPQGEAVDRPVAALVVAVAAAQLGAELGDLGGVFQGRGLGGEQRAGCVAQREQRAQL